MNRIGPFLIHAFEFLVVFTREQSCMFCSVAEIKGTKVFALKLQIHAYFIISVLGLKLFLFHFLTQVALGLCCYCSATLDNILPLMRCNGLQWFFGGFLDS